MDEADFPEIFVRGLHICILNHPAHFARFHNTRVKQLRKRDRGEDGERQTGRWDRQRDRRSGVPEGVSLSSSAGAVSRCRQSGYKQKVFSPLTSSTGPSVGRRHRNAYSPGVTATVCHQSVRLTVLPADNASTRAQLRFIMEGGKKTKKQQAWWNIHISIESHLIVTCALIGWTMQGGKMQWQHLKISVVRRKEDFSLVCH